MTRQKEAYVIQPDGNQWCATGAGFEDLHDSDNYAFGDTKEEALSLLIDFEEERTSPIPQSLYTPSDILKYFMFHHLPPSLKIVSKPFCLLAAEVDKSTGDPREKAVALRKLLEAKDAAVRAAV